MSASLVQRIVQGTSRHSVVELHEVCHVFASVVPRVRGNLQEQTRDALENGGEVMAAEGAAGGVLHQTVFVAEEESVAACRRLVREFYGRDLPATSYVLQPPCGGQRLAIEALGLGRGREKVKVERLSDQVVVARHDGVAWLYADRVVPRTSAVGVYEKTICTYQLLRRLLPEGGARLGQILRIWHYLGGIVEDQGPVQRYKEMNRARAEVYQHVDFLADSLPDGHHRPAYPSSTGIGTAGRSVCLSAVAMVGDANDLVAVPLENPRQTSAFSYAATYSPKSPKFSRGLALCHGAETTLFISGTASITHSETQHPGDVAAQTHETLENISALISEDNLSRHDLPGRGTALDGLAVARVYVKRPQDYAQVRAVCEARLGTVPATYVVADICRPDLLVEIEGIAFSRITRLDSASMMRRRHVPASVCTTADEGVACCPGGCPERLVCPYAVLG
jgi:enamine deaminase RidA (YjgF/YER057c/UK114 family)